MDALYNGVKMQTINGQKTIFGGMASVCSDILAQHALAGFEEGVGFAYSKCRQCSFEDMQSHISENAFTKRTFKRHIRQTHEIEKSDTVLLRNNLRTTYGIIWDAFDIIQQTPQDIMHVILEGIAPLEIKSVLHHLVQSGVMDLDTEFSYFGFPYTPLYVRASHPQFHSVH